MKDRQHKHVTFAEWIAAIKRSIPHAKRKYRKALCSWTGFTVRQKNAMAERYVIGLLLWCERMEKDNAPQDTRPTNIRHRGNLDRAVW